MKRVINRRVARRGAAVVEMAVVAPLFILALVGMLELGYAYMVKQTTTLAAREGSRAGVLPGGTLDDIHTAVDGAMEATRFHRCTPPEGYDPENPDTWGPLDGYVTRSNINDLGPTDVELWVQVEIPLSVVSLTGGYVTGDSHMIKSRTYMRREGVDSE